MKQGKLVSHSWHATLAHQKGWCWSVMSCAPVYGLRIVCEQSYCLQAAALPAQFLFFSSISFSTPHPLCTMAVFTLSETFCLCYHFSITWWWVTVYSRVSSAVLSCASTRLDCYTKLLNSDAILPTAQCSCDAWWPAAPQHHCNFRLMIQTRSRYCRHT